MSSHPRPNLVTYKAGAAISRGMVVKPGADAQHVVKSALATNKNFGIAYCDATTAEDPVEVALPGGGSVGLLGDSVSFGDLLTSDTAGKLVATTTANDKIVAQALSDGSAGDLIPVNVVIGNY